MKNHRVLFIGILLLLMVGLSQSIPATAEPLATVVLSAESDAYIASNFPSTNFGIGSNLHLGYDATNGSQQVLVRFELADGVPDNALIQSASLELFVNSAVPTFDPPLATDVYRVDTPWSESIVDWNKTPQISGVIDTIGVMRTSNYYSWDVTDVVQDWTNGTQSNFGLMLVADANQFSQRERIFDAKRQNGGFFEPRLVVSFTEDSDPPNVSVNSLPNFSESSFTVSWSGSDVGDAGLDYYDVQFRAGGDWQDWQTNTTATSATFSGATQGSLYEFRARGVDKAGNVQTYGGAQASTTISNEPSAKVDELKSIQSSPLFLVSWTADANGGPAVTSYDLYYFFNHGPATLVQSGLTTTSITFNALQGDGLYQFEVVGRNNVGRQEPFNQIPETSTFLDAQAPFIDQPLWLPLAMRP